ncbi:hypothetical protein B566_EDAN010082 [Ephemera danica]|nr:hypothetical protein B566_EDAN010082 [Ephemera danica]
MALNNNAIPGEASESDSEEEINTVLEETSNKSIPVSSVSTPLSPQGSQGRIVAGEAPESDEEIGDGSSVSSAASVSSIASLTSGLRSRASSALSTNKKPPPVKHKPNDEIKFKTLLHKKLRERNISLWRNVTELVHLTASQASRDLNNADQQLLKSQGILQETAAQLRIIGGHVELLREKLDLLTATQFLPQITLPQDEK